MAYIDTDKLEWRATAHGTPCLYKEDIESAISEGRVIVVDKDITRKELHEKLFGFGPPELDSPLYQCSQTIPGCSECKYQGDSRCGKVWWDEKFLTEGADAPNDERERK